LTGKSTSYVILNVHASLSERSEESACLYGRYYKSKADPSASLVPRSAQDDNLAVFTQNYCLPLCVNLYQNGFEMLADRPKTDTITDFIAQDLKDRILANRPLPAKLTLTALAHHYRVSLTPVRLAINTLLEEKLLRKRDNGRIEVNSVSAHRTERKPKTSEVQPPPTPMDWETALAQEVIVRSLTGNDDYLREEAMSQRFGIGRTVLRQVFNRLAGKGLLEHKPRCGWRIRTFNEEDMRAYLAPPACWRSPEDAE
jgi:DNA-binding GntR family transcriptional regulator